MHWHNGETLDYRNLDSAPIRPSCVLYRNTERALFRYRVLRL